MFTVKHEAPRGLNPAFTRSHIDGRANDAGRTDRFERGRVEGSKYPKQPVEEKP